MEMTSPTNIKEVQSLNGRTKQVHLKSNEKKCFPFFCTLKKFFEWTAECQQTFEDLKSYMSSPPLLSPSKLREELFHYLAVSLATVSTALVREEDKVQKPIYYTSWAFQGVKERYPPMEKLAFALVTVARKL